MRLHEELLAEAGSSWDDWRAIDVENLTPERVRHYETEISRIVEEEFGAAPLIVLKEPRICRFVPLYAVALVALGYETKFIHVNRNPLEVGASLEKRDRIAPPFADLIWLRHVLDAEAASRRRPRVFVSYETLLADWRSTIRKVVAGIGLDLPIDAGKAALIDSFLNPEQRHHSASRTSLQNDERVAKWLKDAYAASLALEADANDPNAMSTLDRVRMEFNDAALHFGEAVRAEMTARADRILGEKDRFLGEKERIFAGELREKDRIHRRTSGANRATSMSATGPSLPMPTTSGRSSPLRGAGPGRSCAT